MGRRIPRRPARLKLLGMTGWVRNSSSFAMPFSIASIRWGAQAGGRDDLVHRTHAPGALDAVDGVDSSATRPSFSE